MGKDQAATAGAVVAAVWLVALISIDFALPPTVVPDTLFGLAPLIACAVLPPLATAGFGVLAVGLLIWSGWYNDTWDTAQQWVRLVDVILVGVVAVVIAEVRVRRERRLERLTTIAETAQRAILPTLPHETRGVGIATRYLSAAEDAVVGGDLFDFCLVGGYTRFVVGDVRGKGIAAVEQAARVIRAFRQSAATKDKLCGVAQDMSSYLTPFLGEEEFVTALLVDLTRPDTITVTSCGHPPALLVRRRGEASFVEAPPGLPLGIGQVFTDVSVTWEPGDRLLLYTDGLSEARDSRGEFLPVESLDAAVRTGSVERAVEEVVEEVRRYVPRGRLEDDLAVVVIGHLPEAAPAGGMRGTQNAAVLQRRMVRAGF